MRSQLLLEALIGMAQRAGALKNRRTVGKGDWDRRGQGTDRERRSGPISSYFLRAQPFPFPCCSVPSFLLLCHPPKTKSISQDLSTTTPPALLYSLASTDCPILFPGSTRVKRPESPQGSLTWKRVRYKAQSCCCSLAQTLTTRGSRTLVEVCCTCEVHTGF